ncbi:MAG: hypothetical protein J6S14_11685 [Clostridia bacterium]|nr:hypothetical protein [Clostridia bacterium]
MTEELRTQIQEAFAGCYCLDDVAMLYFDIRTECEKQLHHTNFQIAKEMMQNGVLDEKGGEPDA